MPNLINPLGNRLGGRLFWRGAYPVVYQLKEQFAYFELVMNVRLLVSLLLIRILNVQPSPQLENHLHGLLLSLIVNVWGGHADRCSIFIRLFDYKLVLLLLETNVREYFVSQFAKLMAWNWASVTEGGLGPEAFRTRIALPIFLVGGGGSVFLRVKQFIEQYVTRIGIIFEERVELWHYVIIAFTRPYFSWLADKYSFTKLMFTTFVEHGSLTAGMLVRYMLLKLKQGFGLTQAIKNVRNGIHQAVAFGEKVIGYKLCCSGRFTRKQIATYRWVRHGYLSLNQLEAGMDYAQAKGVCRHGAYGIKLWFFYG